MPASPPITSAREMLEATSKALCWRCADGVPRAFYDDSIYHEWRHGQQRCLADDVLRLAARRPTEELDQ